MAIALAFAVTFIAFTALNAARVVLTLYALTLGALAASVGVLGGMFYIFPLLLSWPIGSLADRIGPRRLLLAGALTGTGAMLLPYFVREIGAFYAAAALSGLSIAFFHVTLQNLVGVLSARERRARNFSNFSMVGATTNFVGPLIAGLSIDHLGYAPAALVVVAFSGIGLLLVPLGWRQLPAPRPRATVAAAENLPADPGVWRMLVANNECGFALGAVEAIRRASWCRKARHWRGKPASRPPFGGRREAGFALDGHALAAPGGTADRLCRRRAARPDRNNLLRIHTWRTVQGRGMLQLVVISPRRTICIRNDGL